jgi:hypothetical protein
VVTLDDDGLHGRQVPPPKRRTRSPAAPCRARALGAGWFAPAATPASVSVASGEPLPIPLNRILGQAMAPRRNGGICTLSRGFTAQRATQIAICWLICRSSC